MSKVINVILSGGVGSRLWPLSRRSKPKQYLPIFNGQSLFGLTVARNRNICDRVLLVGSAQNIELARTELTGLPHDILQEPPLPLPRFPPGRTTSWWSRRPTI